MNDASMVRTHQFALLANRRQRRVLDALLESQRLVYNAALQEWADAYRWACRLAARLGLARFDRAAVEAIDPATLDPGRVASRDALLAWEQPNWYRQKASLTLKAQRAILGEVVLADPSNITRWTLMRMEKARQAFYDRARAGQTPGFPRFRSRSRWSTIGVDELADGALTRPVAMVAGRRGAGHLKLPGIAGSLRVRMERMLPDGAEVRAATLTRRGTRWTVSLQCRVPRPEPLADDADIAHVADDAVVGMDWGVADLATLDDGTVVANTRPNARIAGRVRRAARVVARARRGSHARRNKVAALARLRTAEANARRDALRKAAAKIVGTAQTRGAIAIAMEDLRVASMTRSASGTVEEPGRNVRQKAGLNRGILDAAPARLMGYVRDRAESAGLRTVMVRPHGTSIECSSCGADAPKTLRVRTHACPRCGLAIGRDVNAARNIARRGAGALRVQGRAAQGRGGAPASRPAGRGMPPRRGATAIKSPIGAARAVLE